VAIFFGLNCAFGTPTRDLSLVTRFAGMKLDVGRVRRYLDGRSVRVTVFPLRPLPAGSETSEPTVWRRWVSFFFGVYICCDLLPATITAFAVLSKFVIAAFAAVALKGQLENCSAIAAGVGGPPSARVARPPSRPVLLDESTARRRSTGGVITGTPVHPTARPRSWWVATCVLREISAIARLYASC
jgi:hypothetical protein